MRLRPGSEHPFLFEIVRGVEGLDDQERSKGAWRDCYPETKMSEGKERRRAGGSTLRLTVDESCSVRGKEGGRDESKRDGALIKRSSGVQAAGLAAHRGC